MTEEEIIKLVKERDQVAFGQLVEIYKPIVERFAFQFGIKPKDIGDIVQETFLKVYRKIDRFDNGKLSTWVYQITLNTARDFHRKQKRDRDLVIKSQAEKMFQDNYGYYFEKQEHLIIHECLQKLDSKYKLPIILYYFHENTYEEIASILKCSTSTVKTRMHRAKKMLKKSFEQIEGKEVYLHG